ncbi:MAG TPA: zf-HC2 domain-containing protein [Polyangiaceae bacterium]|nr:zf-HC2 domain-containing protein [Polyangiaceae bacterium]
MSQLERSLRRRGSECASDLQLDQLFTGELSAAAMRTLRAHLASCSACAGRYAELDAERAGFAEQEPGLEELLGSPLEQRVPRPPRALWLGRIALPAAAVLALGVGWTVLLRERSDQNESESPVESTRAKGAGAAFGFVVRRGERSFAGEPGEVLHPGDVLRFTLSSALPSYAGVWGVDALGRVSPYQAGAQLAFVPAGRQQALPEAAELDESLGSERLIAVVCSRPVPASEVGAALGADPGAPRLPDGCSSETLAIVKAPR